MKSIDKFSLVCTGDYCWPLPNISVGNICEANSIDILFEKVIVRQMYEHDN